MDFKSKMIAALNQDETITTMAKKYSEAIKNGINIKKLDDRTEHVIKDKGYLVSDFVNEVIRIENENYYKHKAATLEQ